MANTLERVVVQTGKLRDFATATYSNGYTELLAPADGIALADEAGVYVELVNGEGNDE